MKIGQAQLLVEGGEPDRNFERAVTLIEQAAAEECDLVLLPETIDFAWTHPSCYDEALPIPGPYSELFCEQARKHGLWICVGLTERTEDGKLYNAALLIDSTGEIVLKYHKINLLEVEHPFYEIGQHLEVVDTPFGKIGVNICADNYLDGIHIGHALARMGAQVILSPASWTVDYSITEEDEPYRDKWIKPLSILARYYEIVVVSTTSAGYIVGGPYEGMKMVGKSLAVGPDGILAEGMFNEFAGELVTVEFDVPKRSEKGTQIGAMLKRKGYVFEELPQWN
jgi:predicted amidohydrolase